jgi:BirA family transcriptional regulator, biotin operon repressor / biotin---[acetyl-CoA-carboxylase] ligase
LTDPLSDRMSLARTWHLDTRHIGHRVLSYDVTDSTNDRAAELAGDSANAGTVVVAHTQTAGRGQHGRAWQSAPSSSVLLSVLLFPPPALRRPALLTAWAAVCVGESILRATGLQARIKWPNDLLLRGKKVCGILIESKVPSEVPSSEFRVPSQIFETRNSELGTRNSPVVVGIGLNVNQTPADFGQMGLPDATSLKAATGVALEGDSILRVVIEILDTEYDRLLQGDTTTLEACWKWRVGLLGKRVTAECADGTEVHGRLREMAFAGLELEQTDGSMRMLVPEAVRHLR